MPPTVRGLYRPRRPTPPRMAGLGAPVIAVQCPRGWPFPSSIYPVRGAGEAGASPLRPPTGRQHGARRDDGTSDRDRGTGGHLTGTGGQGDISLQTNTPHRHTDRAPRIAEKITRIRHMYWYLDRVMVNILGPGVCLNMYRRCRLL